MEIFYNNQWGTVCDDGWDVNDAKVVCKQLGFPQATFAYTGCHGQGSGPIWLDDVLCTGTEPRLHDCGHSGIGTHNCGHSEDTVVQCSYASSSVRLVDGGANYGRVEVYHSGVWGTVCDDYWDIYDARVVCRQLGFSDAYSAPLHAKYGYGSGTIWLDDVACTGLESSIFACPHRGWGIENCGHGEDAGVVCIV